MTPGPRGRAPVEAPPPPVRDQATSRAVAASDRSPHPRIRARRVEVARDVGRLRRRRLNVVLGLICLAVWTMVGIRSSLLDVDRVQVDGTRHTSVADLREAAGIATGDPMATVDLGAATAGAEALPWVDEARVQRMWPGTIRVVVTERAAVATVDTPDGAAVTDGEGRVLAVLDSPPDLVHLAGRRDVAAGDTLPASDRTVLATVAGLPDALAPDVEAASVGEQGVVLDLAGGWSVVVGDERDLADKTTAALAVRDAADPAAGCTIDVRVPSAPVLTSGGRCA